MFENIRDFFVDNPKVRIGGIITVIVISIIWIAYAMDSSSQTSSNDRRAERQQNKPRETSFLGVERDLKEIDMTQASDIVHTMNRRLTERERDIDANENRQKREMEELRNNMAILEAKLASVQNESRATRSDQGRSAVEVGQEGSRQSDYTEAHELSPEEAAIEYRRQLALQQQIRRQQEFVTQAPPQHQGGMIRTITQNSVREITSTGEMHEERRESSRIVSERRQREMISKEEEEIKTQRREQAGSDNEFTLAMGSIISGTTLNGVAAQTSVGSTDNPVPVLMRVKREAIMPNYFTLDIRECHMLGSAVGSLASSRVLIRAEAISCITNDGQAIEKNITAYAVSARDGLAGIPGEIVNRSNEMLSNTLSAGFLSGFAQAATPQRVQSINTTPTTNTLYQSQNLDEFAGAGIMTGASSALSRLADYYMTMADSMWPVIEILPGAEIDFIVQRGMTMKIDGRNTERDYNYD